MTYDLYILHGLDETRDCKNPRAILTRERNLL